MSKTGKTQLFAEVGVKQLDG